MLHNTAEPKLTPRSQKAHRGAKNHTAEPNIIPRSHFISTAEPTPRRGAFFVPLGFSSHGVTVQQTCIRSTAIVSLHANLVQNINMHVGLIQLAIFEYAKIPRVKQVFFKNLITFGYLK